jgi:hypothetical protein
MPIRRSHCRGRKRPRGFQLSPSSDLAKVSVVPEDLRRRRSESLMEQCFGSIPKLARRSAFLPRSYIQL